MKRSLQTFLVASLAVLGLAGALVFSRGYAQTQTPTPAPTSRATPATPTAAEPTAGTISVNGIGRISVVPDMATVRLGVQTEGESAADALSENNTQMTAVLNALQRANVARADIQTRNLMLFPRYESPDPQSTTAELAGYTVTNTAEVRIRNLNNLGTILDAAVQAGANTIESVQFRSDDAPDQRDEAYEAAMADARQKAERLAQLAGGELGDVLDVAEFGLQSPLAVADLGIGGGQIPVEPGTQLLEVILQVTWRLR